MSRKNFIAIAAQIRRTITDIRALDVSDITKQAQLEGTFRTVEGLCCVFSDQNPGFDSARFLNACGM